MADQNAAPGASPPGESGGVAPAGSPNQDPKATKIEGVAPPATAVATPPPGTIEVPVRDKRYWRDQFFQRQQPPAPKPAPKKDEFGDDIPLEPTPNPVDLRKQMDEYFTERFGPAFDALHAHDVDVQANTFLARPENAHFKQHEATARKYAEHEAYAKVPIDFIFKALDYENALTRGASQSRKAEVKVEARRLPGTPARQTPQGVPDFSKMSKKEIDEFNSKVRAGLVVKPEEE